MKKANRLVHEKSPYLLQHAHNPVDWYPWGDEAFHKAQREDKPVFLSVGYSTCHWCHVMERESFENEEIARVLNESFVCIKVDREERPDVDQVYMTFVQASTGSGGWPMSVWLTPEGRPFFGGTYFPPQRRGNRPGFLEVIETIRQRWSTQRDEMSISAENILQQLRQHTQMLPSSEDGSLNAETLDRAYRAQHERFDPVQAGFGGAPKFPRPYELLFLHRIFARTGDPQALEMSLATLRAMANGGIHDHLGGGFHRYSTDAAWRLPHFEKMLYDQAQLLMAYAEAYQLSEDPFFANVARDIIEYVRQNLTGAEGAFLCAEDADSAIDAASPEEKEEGAFYVWTRGALDSLLGDDAELLCRRFGVLPQGNVGAELAGQNVLYAAEPLADVAAQLGLEVAVAETRLRDARQRLSLVRSRRPYPHKDDKVLTAWNGLMISALARSASILGAPEDLEAATKAATFIQAELWKPESRTLLRRYRAGEAAFDAFNADYAFLVQGLLDLYEAGFEFRWLEWARDLTERQIELFGDAQSGGFFEDSGADARILLRSKDRYDGAEPSSNSISVSNLLRLGEMLDEERYREWARRTLELYATPLQRQGGALPAMLLALDSFLSEPNQIIIAGQPGGTDTAALLAEVHRRYQPHRVLLLADGGPAQARLAESLPMLEHMGMQAGKATAFVCKNYTCELPVNSPESLAELLSHKP